MLEGVDPSDALNKHGYGQGALAALDFYATGDNTDYYWDSVERDWKSIPCDVCKNLKFMCTCEKE